MKNHIPAKREANTTMPPIVIPAIAPLDREFCLCGTTGRGGIVTVGLRFDIERVGERASIEARCVK